MTKKNKIILTLAGIIIIVAGIYVYKLIYPNEPPQVVITDEALETVKKENADMRRRLEEFEKQIKREAQQIKAQEHEKVKTMSPDAVAGAIADELRLFLGAD